jgi:cell division protease FtsH
VEKAYARAKKVLTDNREGLEKLAKKLLEKEVIYSDDLVEIFGSRPWGNEPMSVKKHLAEGRRKKKGIKEDVPEIPLALGTDGDVISAGNEIIESKKHNTGTEPAAPDQSDVDAKG